MSLLIIPTRITANFFSFLSISLLENPLKKHTAHHERIQSPLSSWCPFVPIIIVVTLFAPPVGLSHNHSMLVDVYESHKLKIEYHSCQRLHNGY